MLVCFFFPDLRLEGGGPGVLCPIEFFRGCKSSSWKFEFPGAAMKEDKKTTD